MRKRERGILFNDAMIRAILAGRKTMTRRPVIPQPTFDGAFWTLGGAGWSDGVGRVPVMPCHSLAARSPTGCGGDLLWMREAWRVGAWNETTGCVAIDYRADGHCRKEWLVPSDENEFLRLWRQSSDDACKVYGVQDRYTWAKGQSPCRWRPSIHMPRWASRDTLEVEGVCIERLCGITEEDARAEGIQCVETDDGEDAYWCVEPSGDGPVADTAVDVFAMMWDAIYSKRGFGFSANPWVWATRFKMSQERMTV